MSVGLTLLSMESVHRLGVDSGVVEWGGGSMADKPGFLPWKTSVSGPCYISDSDPQRISLSREWSGEYKMFIFCYFIYKLTEVNLQMFKAHFNPTKQSLKNLSE